MVIIRKAVREDIEQIAQVHVACWKTTYKGIFSDEYLNALNLIRSKMNWQNTFDNNPADITFVAVNDDSEIIGFCSGGSNRDKKDYPYYNGEMKAIYILQEYQKKGIGTFLVKEFSSELMNKGINNMLTWVLQSNRCKSFYEKLGGKFIGRKTYIFENKEFPGIGYGFDDLNRIKNVKIIDQ